MPIQFLTRLRATRRARVFWEWLAVGVIATAIVLGLFFSHATDQADRLVYDQLMRVHTRTPSSRIVIVAIDDASLAALGAWPWPRTRHAALIDRLTAAKASAVGYDVLFLEPDLARGDARLAQALRASGRTVLPMLFLAPGENGRAVKAQPPLSELADAARGIGQVELSPDSDGVIRRTSSALALDGVCWLHMTRLVRQAAEGGAGGPDCASLTKASLGVNGLLATPPRLVPFAGPPGRFTTVSAVDVLRGEVPPAFFRDRMVLVGASAAGLGDRHLTAVSGRDGAMPGVELQANLLDAALQGKAIISPPRWLAAVGALAPVAVFLAMLLVLEPAANMIVGAVLIAAVFVFCLVLFFLDIWAPPFSAAAGLLIAYPLWSWRRLVVASAYLTGEIARFPTTAAPDNGGWFDDTLGRQVGALARAADLLRDLSQEMQEALQGLPDATVIVDPAGHVRIANEKAAAFSRGGGGVVVGQPIGAWLSSALGALESQVVIAALAEGAKTFEITSQAGVDYEVGQAVMTTPAGVTTGAVVRLTDITAIRRANRQRDEVLQLLTHDLRAPLASILALLELGDRPADPQSLDRIGAYARRGLDLAESYVQLARAESYRFQPSPIDLGQALLDAVDEIWPLANAKGVTLDTDVPDDPALVDGERSLITRALINILDNAVKYSPKGASVRIALVRDEQAASCVIADEGAGLSAEHVKTLFEPFNRGEGWRSGAAGAGLGLAMVHTVAMRHGGRIRCDSIEGKGSTFVFSLPLPPDTQQAV